MNEPPIEGQARSWWRALSAPERVRLVLEAVGVVAVIAAVVGLWLEFWARQEDRVNRAWMLVAEGVGVRSALEFLNRRGEDLSGLDLKGVYLNAAKLRGAKLDGVYLSEADLANTDLADANLTDADLSNALLCRTMMPNATRCDRHCDPPGACPWFDAPD